MCVSPLPLQALACDSAADSAGSPRHKLCSCKTLPVLGEPVSRKRQSHSHRSPSLGIYKQLGGSHMLPQPEVCTQDSKGTQISGTLAVACSHSLQKRQSLAFPRHVVNKTVTDLELSALRSKGLPSVSLLPRPSCLACLICFALFPSRLIFQATMFQGKPSKWVRRPDVGKK